MGHPGIVSGGQKLSSQRLDPVQQGAKLDGPVAYNAGIGRPALTILPNKGLDHRVQKLWGEIQHVKGKSQPPGHLRRVLRIRQGAAGRSLSQSRTPKQLEIHARDLISRLLEQQGGHGTIHTTAHGYKNMRHHRPPFQSVSGEMPFYYT